MKPQAGKCLSAGKGGSAGVARAEELSGRCPSEKQWRGQSFAGVPVCVLGCNMQKGVSS